jgi:hypothetical protein
MGLLQAMAVDPLVFHKELSTSVSHLNSVAAIKDAREHYCSGQFIE